jgi:hypothetical protein
VVPAEKPFPCEARDGVAERKPAVEPLLAPPDALFPNPLKPCRVPARREGAAFDPAAPDPVDDEKPDREEGVALPRGAGLTRDGGGAESDRVDPEELPPPKPWPMEPSRDPRDDVLGAGVADREEKERPVPLLLALRNPLVAGADEDRPPPNERTDDGEDDARVAEFENDRLEPPPNDRVALRAPPPPPPPVNPRLLPPPIEREPPPIERAPPPPPPLDRAPPPPPPPPPPMERAPPPPPLDPFEPDAARCASATSEKASANASPKANAARVFLVVDAFMKPPLDGDDEWERTKDFGAPIRPMSRRKSAGGRSSSVRPRPARVRNVRGAGRCSG